MIRPAARLFLLACLAAQTLLATPAAAHWDRTRWGMTPEAVKALYPSLEPSGDPAKRDPSRPVLGFPTPYVFDGQSFSLTQLFFEGGRLSSVALTTDREDREIPGLLAWVEGRYGRPAAVEGSLTVPQASGLRFYSATWAAPDGDRVKLVVMVWPNGDALSAVSWKPPSG